MYDTVPVCRHVRAKFEIYTIDWFPVVEIGMAYRIEEALRRSEAMPITLWLHFWLVYAGLRCTIDTRQQCFYQMFADCRKASMTTLAHSSLAFQ